MNAPLITFDAIRPGEKFTTRQIAERTGIKFATACTAVCRLARWQQIRRAGLAGQVVLWEINPDRPALTGRQGEERAHMPLTFALKEIPCETTVQRAIRTQPVSVWALAGARA